MIKYKELNDLIYLGIYTFGIYQFNDLDILGSIRMVHR